MASNTLVVSEIYGGGGDGTASPYRNDYVVIHNNSDSPVSVDGFSLQTAFGAGATTWSVTALSGTIQGGGYYLVQLGSNTGSTNGALLPTPDATGTALLGSGNSKVAIVSSTTALSGNNPARTNVVDFVGYGGGTAFEGSGAAPTPSQTRSITRLNSGTQDTDQNAADFVTTAPNPRNSSATPFVCYVSGTLIATPDGATAVERLAVGDRVVTASGEERAIRWIGHRTMPCRGRKDAMPVRIAAHAFGEGRPARDLFVSPAHAIAVDVLGEVLIPACRLINGTTIAQVEAETVTYWHVELDSHDILLAEGLPAESYLDCGNRGFFAEAEATDLAAVPDARPKGPLPFCRPFHETGPLVDLLRARLQDRAESIGWQRVEDTFAGLHLVADGRVIEPDVAGLTARFVLPADAQDVRLVSATSAPADVLPGSTDDRRLGAALAALTIDDGLTGAREIALDDTRLGEGFHVVEGGMRWTDGAAVLPASLWAGCRGTIFLRVALARPALPRWVAPGETAGAVDLAEIRRQA